MTSTAPSTKRLESSTPSETAIRWPTTELLLSPARQGEQNRPRSVRFAAIPRVAQSDQRRSLFCVCPNRGFARHDPSPKSDQMMESRPASVGQPDHTCLARLRDPEPSDASPVHGYWQPRPWP